MTHTVISLMGMGKYGPMLQQHGIAVYCLNMPKGSITVKGLVSLWKLIRRERPDVLQTWMYHADMVGGITGFLAGTKNIFWCIHNSTLLRKSTPWKTLLVSKICAALSYFLPKKIICCAQSAIDVNQAQGYRGSKFVLVPNGYDLTEFYPDPVKGTNLRKKMQVPADVFLLGMVARFDPQKDIHNMVRATGIISGKIDDFSLLLVGTGMEMNNTELSAMLAHEGVSEKVVALGQQDDIPAIMNSLDILVLSSRYGEAFPNVLCEAMACGTPCVSTSIGDSAFIISDTGWIVPPQNSELLADAVLSARNAWLDKNNWRTLQENARKRIDMNFSVDKMVRGYHNAWGIN